MKEYNTLKYFLQDMSNSSDSSSDGKSLENGKVFQVGFNISLPGKPGANFDIVFNEKGEAITQLTPSSSTSVQALPSTSMCFLCFEHCIFVSLK